MKNEIQQIVLNNSVNVDINKDLIYSQDFKKLTEDLDDLFALHIVIRSLRTNKDHIFISWVNTYFDRFGLMNFKSKLNERIYSKKQLLKIYKKYYIKP